MVKVVHHVVEFGNFGETDRVQIQTMMASHFSSALRLSSSQPSSWSSFDAWMLCWLLMIMNLLFSISFQSLGFVLRRFSYASTGMRQILWHWLMSPIWRSSAFTLFTIFDSNFRMMYLSLAIMHYTMSTLKDCIPNKNKEVQLSQNSFWIAINFHSQRHLPHRPHPGCRHGSFRTPSFQRQLKPSNASNQTLVDLLRPDSAPLDLRG